MGILRRVYKIRRVSDLPIPDPEMVRAARGRLSSRFSTGVDALLWEEHKRPMPDDHALLALMSVMDGGTDRRFPTPDAIDFGAALLVLQALHLDLDRLEARLLTHIFKAGLDWDGIAAVLSLADAESARTRFEEKLERAGERVDEVSTDWLDSARRPSPAE
ncbi:MAG: putative lexA DNA-binding domain protein [Streptosporangiaceae bacterium]|nr:putative lexA DNA-binding domain protein [Streptosporangiaceae bacterium]